MMHYLRYARTVLRHKYFVFRAGLKTGAPIWQLIIHDFSKFSPAEFIPYARNFELKGGPAPIDQEKFAHAWIHHVHKNPHHWEHWLRPGRIDPTPMPERYIREMLADWMGASRVYGGEWPKTQESWGWWQQNKDKIVLHAETRSKLMQLMDKVIPLGPSDQPPIERRDPVSELMLAHPAVAFVYALLSAWRSQPPRSSQSSPS